MLASLTAKLVNDVVAHGFSEDAPVADVVAALQAQALRLRLAAPADPVPATIFYRAAAAAQEEAAKEAAAAAGAPPAASIAEAKAAAVALVASRAAAAASSCGGAAASNTSGGAIPFSRIKSKVLGVLTEVSEELGAATSSIGSHAGSLLIPGRPTTLLVIPADTNGGGDAPSSALPAATGSTPPRLSDEDSYLVSFVRAAAKAAGAGGLEVVVAEGAGSSFAGHAIAATLTAAPAQALAIEGRGPEAAAAAAAVKRIIRTTVVPDAAVGAVVARCSALVIAPLALSASGQAVTNTAALMAAMQAKAAGVPVYAVASAFQVLPVVDVAASGPWFDLTIASLAQYAAAGAPAPVAPVGSLVEPVSPELAVLPASLLTAVATSAEVYGPGALVHLAREMYGEL